MTSKLLVEVHDMFTIVTVFNIIKCVIIVFCIKRLPNKISLKVGKRQCRKCNTDNRQLCEKHKTKKRK